MRIFVGVLLFLSLLVSNDFLGQKPATKYRIEAEKKSGKKVYYAEGNRVEIVCTNGRRYSGRLSIVSESEIIVDFESFNTEDIRTINGNIFKKSLKVWIGIFIGTIITPIALMHFIPVLDQQLDVIVDIGIFALLPPGMFVIPGFFYIRDQDFIKIVKY